MILGRRWRGVQRYNFRDPTNFSQILSLYVFASFIYCGGKIMSEHVHEI